MTERSLSDVIADAIRAGEPDSDRPTNAALLRLIAERRAAQLSEARDNSNGPDLPLQGRPIV